MAGLRLDCHLSFPTANTANNTVAERQKYTAANTMTYLAVYNQEASLLPFHPHCSQEKSHTSLAGKFKALHQGIIDTPPASPQQTDSYMQGWVEELKEGGGVTVSNTPHPLPPPSWLFHTPHSLPPFLLPPSFYNSIPLNYKPTASRNVCSLPRLLCNCPSTPLWEAIILH